MAQYITRILVVATLLTAGCAAPHPTPAPLSPGHQSALDPCEQRLIQRLCPYNPDCPRLVREMYAAQRPKDRATWLRDYCQRGE